jgi:hypothetical protein
VPVKLLDVPYAKRRKSHKEKLELIRDSINQAERGREELLRLVEEGRVQVGVVRPALDEMFRSDGETLCDARLKVICFVRMCADSNRKLGDMVDRWDALSEQKQKKTTLDQLCQVVGLPAAEFIGIFAPRAYDLGFNLSKMFVGMAQPELVKRSIEAAMDTKTGFADRRMLLQAGGTAPSSKGGFNLQFTIHRSILRSFQTSTV